MSLEQAFKKIPCFIGSFELTSCHLTWLLFFDLTSVDARSACSAKVSCFNQKAIKDENTKLLQHFVALVYFERVSQKIIIARSRSHYQHRAQIFQIFKRVGVKLNHIFLRIKLLQKNFG